MNGAGLFLERCHRAVGQVSDSCAESARQQQVVRSCLAPASWLAGPASWLLRRQTAPVRFCRLFFLSPSRHSLQQLFPQLFTGSAGYNRRSARFGFYSGRDATRDAQCVFSVSPLRVRAHAHGARICVCTRGARFGGGGGGGRRDRVKCCLFVQLYVSVSECMCECVYQTINVSALTSDAGC